MSYKILLPGAWELTQDVQYQLFSLVVPTGWQQVAKSLAQKRYKLQGRGYPSVPVYSLDRIIAGSFPNIIKTERNGWQRPGMPWLWASSRAELSYLPEFIKDWLREEFSYHLGDEVESLLEKLDNDAWQWDEKPTNYSLRLPGDNQYEVDIRYQAIPDFLAIEFLKNPQVTFGENHQYQLSFYRVVSIEQGAELMSWTPYPIPLINNKQQVGTANISFVIRFKLQTVPWRQEPMIYHQLSIRRWLIKPIERLPYRGATAFIGDNQRWLDGLRQPFCFVPLSIKQTMNQENKEPRWSKAISELLKLNGSPLPDINTLTRNPVYNWSAIGEDPYGIQAAIAYDSRHRGDIPCLPGVSPLDLASLDHAIQHKIRQENFPVRRVGEAVKKSGTYVPFCPPVKSQKKGSKEPKNRENSSTPMQRPNIAASAIFRSPEDSPNTILILWETNECKEALIAEICEVLLLSPKGETKTYEVVAGITGEETLYESPYGSLCIKTQHVLDLTQIFDIDNRSVEGNTRQQRRINLMDERIRQIVSSLPKPEKLSGALIEIKRKPFVPESDPKLALRIGAMQAGYVNQHIHAITSRRKDGSEYITKDALHRVQKAVSDLLRQFGILPVPLIDINKDDIDPNMWLTCFSVLRRTRKTTANNMASTVGLMLRINPVTGTVQMTTPSVFYKLGWVTYPDGLRYLLNEKWEPDSYPYETADDMSDEQPSSDTKGEQKFFDKFVSDCLRNCLSSSIEEETHPRVLFMAEAQNARKMLAWLKNPKLPANDLPDGLKRNMTESEINRLLLVRLRVAGDRGEVPVGIVKGSSGSRTNGLFAWQNVSDDKDTAIYLSLRKLLNTEQGTNTLQQKQSRLDDGSRQAGNPKLLEIAVVHHPGIDKDKLACFVHNLRDRWPYFANEVSLPLPFPFATLAKEYAVSAKDTVESEDFIDSDIEVVETLNTYDSSDSSIDD
jgi:hypothetical protein